LVCFQIQVEIELNGSEASKYDECNALVLPSKKRTTKVVKEKKSNQRILSKTQRKKLEKIVDVKKKKANVIGAILNLKVN
jgi:ATP-dependent RNA helicase DHX37/DHR1